ncbi:methyltransferase domain-containing protein [Rhodomicrobium lacus]|uniref:methyltransferase domain-containing protein n=1 Tax=Rhodomicrobium lacus TaxID=2498452 RepID=UPI000F8DE35A|nr:methyltransferase domain-containing protein [Rhodomicrobium lacus]
MTSPGIFDRNQIRRALARASGTLPASDFLIRHAAEELADRLGGIRREFARVADVGAHHGVVARTLAARFPGPAPLSLAPTLSLAEACPKPAAVADAEALPLKQGAFDLVTSALSLHFANDLPGALIQIRRALRPDGLFLAALLGGDTLIELRQAFMQAETETAGGVSPRVFPTADLRDMGGLLQRAGFALPVADSEQLTVTYADALALMRDLKAMGAANPLAARSRRFMRRDTLFRAAAIYAERFAGVDGRVRATFEIIYLCGWSPHESQQQPAKPGSATARLADALKAKEQGFR